MARTIIGVVCSCTYWPIRLWLATTGRSPLSIGTHGRAYRTVQPSRLADHKAGVRRAVPRSRQRGKPPPQPPPLTQFNRDTVRRRARGRHAHVFAAHTSDRFPPAAGARAARALKRKEKRRRKRKSSSGCSEREGHRRQAATRQSGRMHIRVRGQGTTALLCCLKRDGGTRGWRLPRLGVGCFSRPDVRPRQCKRGVNHSLCARAVFVYSTDGRGGGGDSCWTCKMNRSDRLVGTPSSADARKLSPPTPPLSLSVPSLPHPASAASREGGKVKMNTRNPPPLFIPQRPCDVAGYCCPPYPTVFNGSEYLCRTMLWRRSPAWRRVVRCQQQR